MVWYYVCVSICMLEPHLPEQVVEPLPQHRPVRVVHPGGAGLKVVRGAVGVALQREVLAPRPAAGAAALDLTRRVDKCHVDERIFHPRALVRESHALAVARTLDRRGRERPRHRCRKSAAAGEAHRVELPLAARCDCCTAARRPWPRHPAARDRRPAVTRGRAPRVVCHRKAGPVEGRLKRRVVETEGIATCAVFAGVGQAGSLAGNGRVEGAEGTHDAHVLPCMGPAEDIGGVRVHRDERGGHHGVGPARPNLTKVRNLEKALTAPDLADRRA